MRPINGAHNKSRIRKDREGASPSNRTKMVLVLCVMAVLIMIQEVYVKIKFESMCSLFILVFGFEFSMCYSQTVVSQSQYNALLKHRYNSLICGVALIVTERGSGTGFFINSSGDLVTAAHVISQKNFHLIGSNQIDFDVNKDQHISVQPYGENRIELTDSMIDVDKNESSTDLIVLKTGIHRKCWIPLGDSNNVQIGDHVIALGYPGIDNGNPILYDGFISGRFRHPPNGAVGVINGQPIVPNYEIIKVQMPITPGASGAPVIDDSGKVVALISESPMIWTQDLENISQLGRSGQGSGILMSGFDTTKILGELAAVVHDFETTGAGYAIPVSSLNHMRVSDLSKTK